MNQLKETVQEFQGRYQGATEKKTQCEAFLAKLTSKKMTLADDLPAIASELQAQKKSAEDALTQYVADEIGEEALTAARRQVSDLESRSQEIEDLVDALAGEIEKAKEALEKARAEALQLQGICWGHIAKLEAAIARRSCTSTLKRGFLAAQKSGNHRWGFTIADYIKDVFVDLRLPGPDEDLVWRELEEEYVVPRS